jgi:hypothetical protein
MYGCSGGAGAARPAPPAGAKPLLGRRGGRGRGRAPWSLQWTENVKTLGSGRGERGWVATAQTAVRVCLAPDHRQTRAPTTPGAAPARRQLVGAGAGPTEAWQGLRTALEDGRRAVALVHIQVDKQHSLHAGVALGRARCDGLGRYGARRQRGKGRAVSAAPTVGSCKAGTKAAAQRRGPARSDTRAGRVRPSVCRTLCLDAAQPRTWSLKMHQPAWVRNRGACVYGGCVYMEGGGRRSPATTMQTREHATSAGGARSGNPGRTLQTRPRGVALERVQRAAGAEPNDRLAPAP